jgi:DNA mismatch repair ATPase MutS
MTAEDTCQSMKRIKDIFGACNRDTMERAKIRDNTRINNILGACSKCVENFRKT